MSTNNHGGKRVGAGRPAPPSKKITTTFYIDTDALARLTAAAESTGQTRSAIVNRLIKSHL